MHAFLSGLGIALTYTLISILLIDTRYVQQLPLLYLITAVLLLTKGYFYAHLEHSNQPQKLFKWVLLGLFIWSFLMFLNLRAEVSFLIMALAYCSYYVVYYLSNLEYWGTASLLFDVRQGKRLFSLLSSGESVAKILGYAMTPLIISSLDKAYVYLVVAFCFAGAYLIFSRLVKRYKPAMLVHHSHSSGHDDKSGTVLTILTIKEIFKIDNFRKYISAFAFISIATFFLLQYAFLIRVEQEFAGIDQIAVFFATLLSLSKILNLLIKVFLSSRLCRYLGLNVVLLILPVVLLIVSAVGIAGTASGQSADSFIIWVFAAMWVFDEVFRTSLYTPAYLTLFQPLTKMERLEGHTLTKGIMEPLGLGFAGLLIFILIYFDQFQLKVIAPIIILLLISWIFVGTRVFQEYLGILKDALRSKILKGGTLQLSKNEIEILKNEKLRSEDPVEKLYALQMLGNLLNKDEIFETIRALLSNQNSFIIIQVLNMARELEVPDMGSLIQDLIYHDDLEVRKLAVYEYGREHELDCVEFYERNYDSFDVDTKSFVIGSAIKHGGLNGAIVFGRELMSYINSVDPEMRIMACKIISDIGSKEYYHPLIELLSDSDIRVRENAIIASGEIKNFTLIPHIINNKKDKRLRFVIRKSLSSFDGRLGDIAGKLLTESSQQERIEYIRLFDKNTVEEMSKVVFGFINDDNFEVKSEAIDSLFRRNYIPDSSESEHVNRAIKSISTTIKSLLNVIYGVKEKSLKELIYNEIFQIQLKTLLKCMSLSYSRRLFKDVIENCYSSLKTNKTIALELLDNSLTAKDKHILVPLIESVFDLEQNLWNEVALETVNVQEWIRKVLKNANSDYSSWMTANLMRIAELYEIVLDDASSLHRNDIHTIKQESERLRKQTA